ncbi:TPA: hypothetical protein ACH3X1_001544 [Trebouxia sp. C0004]
MGLPRSPVSDQVSTVRSPSLKQTPCQAFTESFGSSKDQSNSKTSTKSLNKFKLSTTDQELQRQRFEVLLSDLESRINEKVAEQIRAKYDPLIQDMQRQIDTLTERLDQSQCSTSQPDHPDQPARQPAHLEQVVHKLTDFTQQQQDKDDSQARQQKQKNAVLQLCQTCGGDTRVFASAKRISTKADAAQGLVVVQFSTKEDNKTVFQARGKLRGNPVGMDDDLTHLQQKRKNAAWPAFKDARASRKKTQWRAEKLFILEGERFVEHKLLDL